MLIIPLHKPLRIATFPWVTALLILANVFVYLAFQVGDERRLEAAWHYFETSGLAKVEVPRYLDWREHHGAPLAARERDLLDGPLGTAVAMQLIQGDAAFRKALAADPPDWSAQHPQDWATTRAKLDRDWQQLVTQKWMMHYDHFEPVNIVTAMFLHGSAGHLIGNMVFLALLGLLVEGALGPGIYLGAYLLGGFGGGVVSLIRHYGDSSGALGASGAIASLMGAFCVLWGLRPVRYFWWFFIAFGYRRGPAILLLPFWLGWELFNLAFNHDSNVGFDVHAGGIASGALLAFLIVKLGLERRAFLDEEVIAERNTTLLADGISCLGKLEFAKARAALGEFVRDNPSHVGGRVAWFRAHRDQSGQAGFHAAAAEALQLAAGSADERAELRKLFAEYFQQVQGRPGWAPELALVVAARLRGLGGWAESAQLLLALDRDPVPAGLPQALLSLALALREAGQPSRAEPLLQRLVERHGATEAAGKARFLLANT